MPPLSTIPKSIEEFMSAKCGTNNIHMRLTGNDVKTTLDDIGLKFHEKKLGHLISLKFHSQPPRMSQSFKVAFAFLELYKTDEAKMFYNRAIVSHSVNVYHSREHEDFRLNCWRVLFCEPKHFDSGSHYIEWHPTTPPGPPPLPCSPLAHHHAYSTALPAAVPSTAAAATRPVLPQSASAG